MSNRKKKQRRKSEAKGNPRRLPFVSRSPSIGDLGFAVHPWLRLNGAMLGIDHPVVMFDIAELRFNGYEPEALGLVRIGDHPERFEIPIVEVVADMKSRYDIDLYEPEAEDMNNPIRIIGGVFDEPHTDEWWSQVHGEKDLFILAGDTPTLAHLWETAGDTPFDFGPIMLDAYIGRIKGLMIRAYSSGVGTAMPGTQSES